MDTLIPVFDFKGRVMLRNTCPEVECPFCKAKVAPRFDAALFRWKSYPKTYRFLATFPCCQQQHFMNCSKLDCFEGDGMESGISTLYPRSDAEWTVEDLPKVVLKKKAIPEAIRELSQTFEEVYNEAYAARQMGYSQICGGGYRKALEILLKDYASFLHPDKRDEIHRMELGNCIKQYIDSEAIQVFANRASWLGNDQLHYTRTWTELDIFDLETLVEQSITAIELEEKRKRLLKDMPKPGKKQ